MKYEPFTTDSTKEIIKEIKYSLPNIEKDQITIDTLDICHLLGEIERLNNIIQTKTDFITDLLELIYYSENNILHTKAHLIGEEYQDKLKELKEGK